ncbi:MAG: TetR family transcriptional regulator [Planctomycetes bacterium]|nr:TetR family transcriptional regulator [Planctomycetota bacterium]
MGKATKKTKTSLRRSPTQERGQQRIEKLLDAAAELFAEVGYEAATTNAIAERAKTSIGSLYQFFPDKDAILSAVVSRYLTELRQVHDGLFTEEFDRLPLPEVFDRVVDTLAEFHRRRPGFRPLFFGSTTSPQLAAAAAEFHQECIGRVDRSIAKRAPQLDAARRRLYATMNVEVVKALLPLSESGSEAFRRQVLGEIKKLLLAYMRQAMEESSGRR